CKGAFDLIFIDADKASAPEYFRRALALSRPGTGAHLDTATSPEEHPKG
ncbi:MAG: methyltransferase, partial [Verrucomicrobia bacterium]